MRAGLLAEFADADALLAAIPRLVEQGYVAIDAFGPRPVDGLDEALRLPRPRQNWFVFPVGLGMATLGFGVQWFCNAWSYPLHVGGRPAFALPAFIPITFESAVLFSSFAAFFGLFYVIGLPRLHHPLFEVEGFERASHDRYFLAVDARDPRFDVAATGQALGGTGPLRVVSFGRIG
ncbi:MAG TPA: DUF3341 domain-containing protein [Polyangia bacterium]|jgi:hypothetical protein